MAHGEREMAQLADFGLNQEVFKWMHRLDEIAKRRGTKGPRSLRASVMGLPNAFHSQQFVNVIEGRLPMVSTDITIYEGGKGRLNIRPEGGGLVVKIEDIRAMVERLKGIEPVHAVEVVKKGDSRTSFFDADGKLRYRDYPMAVEHSSLLSNLTSQDLAEVLASNEAIDSNRYEK